MIKKKKKKTQDYRLIMLGKYESGKIGEIQAWIQNKLIVLNIILHLFCSTMLQQTLSWIKIGR